jgi:iron complex transport system permease protein
LKLRFRGLTGFRGLMFILCAGLVAACVLSLCVGSVDVPLLETVGIVVNAVTGLSPLPFRPESASILLAIRLPRVLLAVLAGASLSVAGGAMQGLIRNPLADGSTLGVTAGGSLGAVLVIATGITLPFLPQLTVTLASIVFAFASLLIILAFVRRVDRNLSSHTIILAGVVFSMLASSLTSLVIAFSGDAVKQIVFWSMGSLAGRGYVYVALLAVFAAVGIAGIFRHARELDAFAMGEEQAAYAGVDVRRVRKRVLLSVAVLCGAAVSVSGNIAFVGLVIPHIVRLAIGPVNTRLLPASALAGAIFLVLCDLVSRTLLRPLELPIGVLTSILGAAVFIVLFYRQRKGGA